MRHAMLTFLLAALLGLVTTTGCNSSGSDYTPNVTFINESSSTVNVKPGEGETFEPFSLKPGESRTVPRDGRIVDYSFTASGDVDGINIESEEVIFIDPV